MRGSTFMTHKPSSILDVQTVQVPDATSTYEPVPHIEVYNMTKDIMEEHNPHMILKKTEFGLQMNGELMFGMMQYSYNGIKGDEIGINVGITNSYNKMIPVKVGIGSYVFVCENGMFNADIVYSRKHTVHIWDELEESISRLVIKADDIQDKMDDERRMLKCFNISQEEGYEKLGLLSGTDILSPNMYQKALKDWKNPRHEEFADRNVWSLYNCATEALKRTHIGDIMEQHSKLHKTILNQYALA